MSNSNRKSFIIHHDSLSVIDELTDEDAGKLLKAIKSFQLNEELELDSITRIVFSPFKSQFIRDAEKWERTRSVRASAGSKGGKQKVANASKTQQNVANVAVSVSKSVSDSVSVSVSEKEKKKRFSPPTIPDVKNYFLEKGLSVIESSTEADKFFNHYESNGWKVGKNKMARWKNAAAGWLTRRNGYENTTGNGSKELNTDNTDWADNIGVKGS